MAWAKEVYAENKVTSDKVIEFALGQMDKQAEWADKDRKRYETVYQPLEDQAARRAMDYASSQRQEAEAGRAEADVAAQFEAARQTAQERLEGYGVDPSQLRSGALDLGSRVAEAAAQAGAGNQARFRTEQYGDQLTANAINVGKGYPGQVLGAAGQAGSSGNQATNTGLAQTASGAQTMGTGYQWQGMGNQALGQWGQMLNAGFQNELAGWQAKQDASSGWMTAAGTLASFLPWGGKEGGAVPDDAEYFADGGIPTDGAPPGPAGAAPAADPATGPLPSVIPDSASPSGGAIPDDIPAVTDSGKPARINAGEFIVPRDVVKWVGEKGMQNFIIKSRKEMGDPSKAPAQPEQGPPPGQQPTPPRGVGAIPEMEGV